jgi:hypothetical protein
MLEKLAQAGLTIFTITYKVAVYAPAERADNLRYAPPISSLPLCTLCSIGYSDYDVFLENDEGSRVYRCKKLF